MSSSWPICDHAHPKTIRLFGSPVPFAPGAIELVKLAELEALRSSEYAHRLKEYMAKAYEYRLLKPYAQPLDLSGLLNRFKDIAAVNPTHEITAAQFDSFRALYEGLVADVAEEIFADYNSNRPELSVPIRFALLPEEISRLNQDEVVTLNLFNEGFFLPTEENVRIYDFKVFDISTQAVGGSYGRVASVDVTIAHTGISNFKSDGAIYQFRHYNTMTENGVRRQLVLACFRHHLICRSQR